jgi:uncharacterized membrane protein
MSDQIRFFFHRMREQLWVRPFLICVFSILAAFVAKIVDYVPFLQVFPDITVDSIETLLTVISTGMLGVAVFAVGAMISAYASASNTATPRSFPLVIADDVSQNTLSAFVGAFIYSIVALVALKNGYYGTAGRFVLFILTVVVFAVIILSFIRWIDRIARLGRLGNTIDRVEQVTADAMRRRRKAPTLGAQKANGKVDGVPIYVDRIGYVQRIDVSRLQALAERFELYITVASLPGTFSTPDRPLAHIISENRTGSAEFDPTSIAEAFVIGKDRVFAEDPRFGLIVLSQIASRALSPAVNDPGTAIDIIGSFIRLFTIWAGHNQTSETADIQFDRVAVPEISADDMLDDAFNAISRDGAGTIEVVLRLQKAFNTLASLGDVEMKGAARSHAQLAFRYAEQSLQLPEEIESLKTLIA